jgi:hypothetical protein
MMGIERALEPLSYMAVAGALFVKSKFGEFRVDLYSG